ncbi:MAG: peptidoglycan synthetase, partial [Bacteroidales bacterium]|nr:peptidoglycan synthetase [Bacteroidales bacterium]
MHARNDNPELSKAKELGITVYSFPEYVYEQTKNKTRIVVGGSHGKTTITSMIMFVMQQAGKQFDYLVGSSIEGFETMVNLSEESEFAVIEGDEYLSSPLDKRPKFHHYKPHLAILSGIAWDHINVFPTFENYVKQFEIFINSIEDSGEVFYFSGDKELRQLAETTKNTVTKTPYDTHPFDVDDNHLVLTTKTGKKVPLEIFGKHNLQNLEAARMICNRIGISDTEFYEHIKDFKGAGRRLQKLKETLQSAFFYDFAHSPSKLKATTASLKEQFPKRKLIACFELHTFSSLNKDFLPQYAHAIDAADVAVVYFNEHTIAHKKLPPIILDDVKAGFQRKDLTVFTDRNEMIRFLKRLDKSNANILMMSSGNFSGIDMQKLANLFLKEK